MISFDCETGGLDFRHGTRPYFVTTCDENGEQQYWEWPVNPETRMPEIPDEDLAVVSQVIFHSGDIVGQNIKFDVTAMSTIIEGLQWPWDRTWDTLLAGHVLASNQPHDLTSMALQYLGADIEPLEKRLHEVVEACRRWARTRKPTWRIAKEGLPDMPSAKEKCWKVDGWLPRVVAEEDGSGDMLARFPDMETVLRDYANADSAVTMALWMKMEKEIKRRGLWEIYMERRKLLRISYELEERGVTYWKNRLQELKGTYTEQSECAERMCHDIAEDYGFNLELGKGGSKTKSLTEFMFSPKGLNLPTIKTSKKTGASSLDKEVMGHYELTLPSHSKESYFVKSLLAKRRRDTALGFIESYERFNVNVDENVGRLHPSLNMTGTSTLRWTCSNPNSQQISKQESICRECDGDGCEECNNTGRDTHTIRWAFGPAQDREWWSLDFQNIELRIPFYEAGEKDLIYLFEHPDEPPYFGSYHFAIFDVLHPEMFKEHGKDVKKKFASTWYQWTKNGSFAMQYGAGKEKADATYHVSGAYDLIKKRFSKLTALNNKWMKFAERYGYVETIPDKNICPQRGYPIMCTRTEHGKILSTVPLSYHVQSTAMWATARAMVRIQERLDEWRKTGFDAFMTLQVHDEIVVDMPFKADKGNITRAKQVQKLMEMSGQDIGVLLTTGLEYHNHNWSEGESV
jgi:DNA polymerase I-like protein with 3'-5' exonuclease and polymerase domains